MQLVRKCRGRMVVGRMFARARAFSRLPQPLMCSAAAAGLGAAVAIHSGGGRGCCEEAAHSAAASIRLDAGYKPRTTNPLAVIRKRPAEPHRPGEPLFTHEQVADHNQPSDMWVTYKDGVYDVTQFAQVGLLPQLHCRRLPALQLHSWPRLRQPAHNQ